MKAKVMEIFQILAGDKMHMSVSGCVYLKIYAKSRQAGLLLTRKKLST